MSDYNTAQETRPEPASTSQLNQAPPRNKRRTCTRWGCFGLVLIGVLLVAAIIFMRVSFKKRYTPDQWTQIEAAQSEVISLPPEWHQPAALPPMKIVTFHNDLQTSIYMVTEKYEDLLFGDYSWQQDLMYRLRSGDTFSANEKTSLSHLLAEIQPLLNEASRTIQVPGYTSEIDLYADNVLLGHQVFAKFASIAGLHQLRKGDPAGALDTMALALRLMERPPQSYLTTHLISIAVASILTTNLHAVADQTSDTAVLRYGLDLLTELRPVIFHKEMENWRYSDVIGSLRNAAANGYPVDLKPQTLVGYYEQAAGASGAHYWDWIIKNLPADDLRVRGAAYRLEMFKRPSPDYDKMFSGSMEDFDEANREWEEGSNDDFEIPEPPDTDSLSYKLQEWAATVALGVHPYAFLYGIALPGVEESRTRVRVDMSIYDLTRLHFARRLAELGAPADELAAVRPSISDMTAYLTPLPDDPFTSAPFRFSDTLSIHYSVGPDKKDDKATIVYNSTNGTTSAGDIWMESR